MKKFIVYFFFLIGIIYSGCGGSGGEKSESELKKEKTAKIFGISVFELENGIGPVKAKISLGPVDNTKAAAGKKIFESKCTQCHKLDERYTGPALRNVTKRRTPEYIINMVMNPQEMTQKHPEAKKLLALHATQMTFQNVTQDDVMAILDFFRSEEK